MFLANADSSLVVATYASIASEFRNLSDGPWLLAIYTLGYNVALPAVSYSLCTIKETRTSYTISVELRAMPSDVKKRCWLLTAYLEYDVSSRTFLKSFLNWISPVSPLGLIKDSGTAVSL